MARQVHAEKAVRPTMRSTIAEGSGVGTVGTIVNSEAVFCRGYPPPTPVYVE